MGISVSQALEQKVAECKEVLHKVHLQQKGYTDESPLTLEDWNLLEGSLKLLIRDLGGDISLED